MKEKDYFASEEATTETKEEIKVSPFADINTKTEDKKESFWDIYANVKINPVHVDLKGIGYAEDAYLHVAKEPNKRLAKLQESSNKKAIKFMKEKLPLLLKLTDQDKKKLQNGDEQAILKFAMEHLTDDEFDELIMQGGNQMNVIEEFIFGFEEMPNKEDFQKHMVDFFKANNPSILDSVQEIYYTFINSLFIDYSEEMKKLSPSSKGKR